MKGNQQDIELLSNATKSRDFCEEILSILLCTFIPFIVVLKSRIYLIFLASPSVLWIREQRVREMNLLKLFKAW